MPVFYAYTHSKENPGSISDDRVYCLLADKEQKLWIATYGGGLNKFDPSTGIFKTYRTETSDPKSISSDKVLCLLDDSKGRIWVGTSGGGLNRFDSHSESFTRYTIKEGLHSAVVYGILEDNRKNLWLSTDDGIFKFDPGTEKFIQFGPEDGLQSMEFSGGAYIKDTRGAMYFGGINGLNYFYPDSIQIRSYIPPVVISNIKIVDTHLKGKSDELILSYDQNFISFEFASLDFSNPSRNRYRYILEGFQNYWTQTDASRRMATYTNLPPGEYLFRVLGTNSDGIWNETGDSIKIIINPPFWQTWWFVTLVIILISFLIYYLSTLRIKNQLAIEKIKLKIASDLHDNVGAGLTEISILSEVASRQVNGTGDRPGMELMKISDTARQLIDNMSDIVWVVNPQRDSLQHLIIRLKDSYNEFFNSVGISFKVKNVDKKDDVKLPMEYKQNLFLIFKEAINNSIKHSNCRKMTLEASVRNDFIEIFITDDGNGFDSEKLKFGNGMKNMFDRARKIGGEIRWNSLPGKGTIVNFKGKLSRINKLKSFFNI
jgi:two-component sensor histidine kinase